MRQGSRPYSSLPAPLTIERPTVRVSISTTVSPRSPEIVGMPPSPVKSLAGVILNDTERAKDRRHTLEPRNSGFGNRSSHFSTDSEPSDVAELEVDDHNTTRARFSLKRRNKPAASPLSDTRGDLVNSDMSLGERVSKEILEPSSFDGESPASATKVPSLDADSKASSPPSSTTEDDVKVHDIPGTPSCEVTTSPIATPKVKKSSLVPQSIIIPGGDYVYIPTPYPRPRAAPPISPSWPPQDSLIFLRVRRRSARNPDRYKTASLVVPNDRQSFTSMVMEKRLTTKYFPGAEFDDAVLFTRMREAYYQELLGQGRMARFWRRRCSARTLVSMAILPSQRLDTEEVDTGSVTPGFYNVGVTFPHEYNSLYTPPLNASLSEDDLIANFCHPASQRRQYCRVQWIHQAARTTRLAPPAGLAVQGKRLKRFGPQIEFVEGWCTRRLVGASASLVLASVAALLLWVFLGGGTGSLSVDGARARLLPGLALSLLVAVLGGVGMVLWIAVSWIVM